MVVEPVPPGSSMGVGFARKEAEGRILRRNEVRVETKAMALEGAESKVLQYSEGRSSVELDAA